MSPVWLAAEQVTTTAATQYHWAVDLFRYGTASPIAHAVLIIGLVAALGLALGTVRVFGISLGIAGVLFVGLYFGHLGFTIDEQILEFAREFGLILFVYTIGMQVGPGFIASLRRQGLPLNLMAAAIVVLGAAIALGVHFIFDVDVPAAVGLFSGATTNTPSLAAAQEAVRSLAQHGKLPAAAAAEPGQSYAIAYPFGVIGIILAMILIRGIFRVNLEKEGELLARLQRGKQDRLATINLEVKNPNLDGLSLDKVPTLDGSGVVISRVMHGNRPEVARPETVLRVGDILLAVGPRERLAQLKVIVGAESKVDLKTVPSHITTRRILVTKSAALGESIEELGLRERFGVNVTRINRAEIELPPTPDVRLQFGDNLVVVGDEDSVKQAAAELGDSPKKLSHPQIIPVFVGIALGVILGSWPLALPGLPAPVKLGLAGGPLIVAILLSRLGNIGPLVWYMPISANFILREVGIVLFLACVGIKAGHGFQETLLKHGLAWMGYGALITLVPILLVGLFARLVYKLNYLSLCGLLAGSMTDPPALQFANAVTGSDAPSVSYATVYPLVMLLRVLFAQAMVLIFAAR